MNRLPLQKIFSRKKILIMLLFTGIGGGATYMSLYIEKSETERKKIGYFRDFENENRRRKLNGYRELTEEDMFPALRQEYIVWKKEKARKCKKVT